MPPLRCLLLLVHAHFTTSADNGLALLPPMGWRSWNAFYADIDALKMVKQVDALVTPRNASGHPAPTGPSLLSLGFDSIGIDEGWEGCGLGVNGTVHYVNGTPTVDPKRFPDMPALVKYGHSKGVQMGFYLNGCGCNEKVEKTINYEGDVKATVAWGFDAVKIDSCGAQKNMTLYGQLFNASGKATEIENCHQGQNITDGGNPDQMAEGWCPYNLFRSSGDIVNLWDRVMSNLMSVVPWLQMRQSNESQYSRPSCWAYPDMLEVGRMPEHNDAESRSHLAAWAIVSAPLVLGFDLSNQERLSEAWPIISNREVLAISQSYVHGADFPTGRLLRQWQAPNVPTYEVRGDCAGAACTDDEDQCAEWAKQEQCVENPSYMKAHCRKSCGACPHGNFSGFTWLASSSSGIGSLELGGMCLDAEGQLPAGHDGSNEMHALPCEPGKPSQLWHFNQTDGALKNSAAPGQPCLRVFLHWLWNYKPIVDAAASCDADKPDRNQAWTLHANGTLQNGQFGCIELSDDAGPPSTIWAKPLAGGKMAVLAINGADEAQHITLDFASLGLTATWSARDVWAATDLGALASYSKSVPAHDCILLVLSPTSGGVRAE